MPGIQRSGLLALGGIALAAVLAVLGHLEVNDDLNPWSLTVSDFAVSDRGGVIDGAMVVLAAATVVLLAPLRRAGARGPARALLLAWSAGLLVAALVPTNDPGTAMGTGAYLHRYASVVAFLVLPVAGWLLAGPLGGRAAGWLRVLALTSLVLAGAMVWSAYPGDRVLIGLVERLLILAEVALLTVVAATLVRRHGTGEVAAFPGPGHRQLAEVAPGTGRARRVTPARGA
ncbi:MULTISPECIES: DUF998 domain-containing protein [Micromonospora]|uniref:DUF998 domain-containing protein n=1 Tax=Micromonospora solifontis TaxID=2487138 RepID=A0ABX9WLF1_9ACTN|nr:MULTISPECIES: DUF998 domain-containing protein [Micromonospora]NES14377.1 DUF998 domain-containing protein [Micromonospora sp. PPF5-17B]NES35015.1 DUF998 domain-containing protein [Micromonospora solifontis]NES57484.1 DUF998 domain-containing protein [Micromonospora sp. PPF5-6]RNM01287.1 DUF998 domain-containing protein [Micromonospora solifontis]